MVVDVNFVCGLFMVQGSMMVFDFDLGYFLVIIDVLLIMEWKIVVDFVLGVMLLVWFDSCSLLIVGVGILVCSLVCVYVVMFFGLCDIVIWVCCGEQVVVLVVEFGLYYLVLCVVEDLLQVVGQVDIVSMVIMVWVFVFLGVWVCFGMYVDLIGVYKVDMCEVDDVLIVLGRLFVDSCDIIIGYIGELMIFMVSGVIGFIDVLGDFYDLVGVDVLGWQDLQDIIIFKNGGGVYLDLMIVIYIVQVIKVGVQFVI